MHTVWTHGATSVVASFLASLVEFVEALTVVLAVGTVRGWRGALSGCAAALASLAGVVFLFGATLTRIPLVDFQLVVGTLLLLFGMRWLRKAILRAAGRIALHDERAAFAKNAEAMRRQGRARNWDRVAFAASFHITMLEGTEVVFIVLAIGAGGKGLLLPSGFGALAALVVVAALGFALHRPLATVPENTLKMIVGVLLSAFGTFWSAEGMGFQWPGADWSILALIAFYAAIGAFTIPLCRAHVAQGAPIAEQ